MDRSFVCYNRVMYDLIIIGAEAAGMAGALAAHRRQLKTLVAAKAKQSEDKQESLGLINQGLLSGSFQAVLKTSEFVEAKFGLEIVNLEKNIVSFSLESKDGKMFYGKSVLITASSKNLSFDQLTQKTAEGRIAVNQHQESSVPGIWAAGECADGFVGGLEAAVGEAIKAVYGIKIKP